jgi:hypothetical protein
MKIQIRTNVLNGKFKRNINQILDAVKNFEGKDCMFTIEKVKKTRSNDQNSYYWGVCMPIVQNGLKDATGEFRTSENIHYNILLKMFAPEREIINTDTGECIREKISSSEMSTSQFMDYIAEIQKWAAEFLGVDIPNPNEETTLNFNN